MTPEHACNAGGWRIAGARAKTCRARWVCVVVFAIAAVLVIVPRACAQSGRSDKAEPPRVAANAEPTPFVGPLPAGVTPGCEVVRVADVRTLVVVVNGRETEVRLLGLEGAAAPGASAAAEARSFLATFLMGERVTLIVPEGAGVDRDARALVIARREPEGLDAGLEALRQGYAALTRAFEAPTEDTTIEPVRTAYAAAAARADELRRGLRDPERARDLARRDAAARKSPPTVKPADTPGSTRDAADEPHGGDGNPGAGQPAAGGAVMVYVTPSGAKYHRQTCRFAKGAAAVTLEEAKKTREPCGVCKPPT